VVITTFSLYTPTAQSIGHAEIQVRAWMPQGCPGRPRPPPDAPTKGAESRPSKEGRLHLQDVPRLRSRPGGHLRRLRGRGRHEGVPGEARMEEARPAQRALPVCRGKKIGPVEERGRHDRPQRHEGPEQERRPSAILLEV